MTKVHDIIIIGAGPSGLSTALHLDRYARGLGLDILILEKSQHPRVKLCAGGILAEGEAILSKLGLDLHEVPHVDVEKAFLNYEGRGMTARLPGVDQVFRVVRRDEFDAWLAGKARERGIEIREEIAVKSIETLDDYALIKTSQEEFRARVVVGADGSNSVVRRAVEKNPSSHVGRALEVITPVKTNGNGLEQNQASFDFLAVSKGI